METIIRTNQKRIGMTDLIFTREGNIYASNKLMLVPEFRNLYNKHGKDVFGNYIIYLYYVYKTYSSTGNFDDVTYMSEFPLQERIDRVFSYHVDRSYSKQFLETKEFVDATDTYIKLQMPKIEQMYVNIKNDIDAYLENLSKIPYKKQITVDLDTPKELVENGYPPRKKVKIEFDNMKEKQEAIKMSNELINYLKKMEDFTYSDRRQKFGTIGNKDIKIFENPDIIKELNFVLFEEELFTKPKDA